MHQRINRVTLQGRIGPPTVRLSPEGPIFASAELEISDSPTATIAVCGYGIDAAGIAEAETGGIVRVTGELALDPPSNSFYVLASEVRRMEPQGHTLVARTPSLKTFDRFELLFLEPDTVPTPAV